MGKKRRARKTPITVTNRLPPWGATKQAADAWERIRHLKNRIHELEQELVASGTKDTSWYPTGTEIEALKKVASMSTFIAQEAGILNAVATCVMMCVRLEKWNRERLRATVDVIRANRVDVGDRVLVRYDTKFYTARVTELGTIAVPDLNGSAYFTATVDAGPWTGHRVNRVVDHEGKTWKWP